MASISNTDAAGDDEALNWDGETDSSHVDGPIATTGAERVVVASGSKPQQSSVLLVTYGILGGAYLLYVIGWIVAVGRSTVTLPNILGEIMFQFGEFLAIGSPLIWLAAVFTLTRNRSTVVRLVWLILGLVLLVPWPFVLGGA
ncbi:MAG: hypothetical protein ACOH1J_06050 [Microbacteriaceae bacterium]